MACDYNPEKVPNHLIWKRNTTKANPDQFIMRKLFTFLLLVCLNLSVAYGQTDTITIYKVNYFELNIPVGWNKFILKSRDSLFEFSDVEHLDTAFPNMLSINPNNRNGQKLLKDLQKWNKRTDIEPLHYKDIGLLYIQSYRIIGILSIRGKNEILIDSVAGYSKTNVDIDDLKLILNRFE